MCSHSLLDQKINNVLSISNDQAILKAIQSIIQNMLATEDPSQQQLHFLQSCGFGGLWRFAGPFTKTSVSGFFWLRVFFLSVWSIFFLSWWKWDVKFIQFLVQFDGRIVWIVCQLLGSDGRNMFARWRCSRNYCPTTSA